MAGLRLHRLQHDTRVGVGRCARASLDQGLRVYITLSNMAL